MASVASAAPAIRRGIIWGSVFKNEAGAPALFHKIHLCVFQVIKGLCVHIDFKTVFLYGLIVLAGFFFYSYSIGRATPSAAALYRIDPEAVAFFSLALQKLQRFQGRVICDAEHW